MPKALVVVESPAKARTLKRYLGKNYNVMASVGHVRDLPVSKLGVDVSNDFNPQYVTIKGKAKIISALKKAAKEADEIYLAPDPDREGEAIAYHISHCLKSAGKPVHRALFHELTKKAILAAMENATEIDVSRFEAQQTRRILDRLVGYQISPLLWEKVRRGLSAGRVQSVAVRMIDDRERQIEAFDSEEYWTIDADLLGGKPPQFTARLEKISDKKARVGNSDESEAVLEKLHGATFDVSSIDKKKRQRRPSPPFITSTMQQDANRKLRFSAKKTMSLAQKLYEGIDLGDEGPTGLITYMRTDSTRVNDDALKAVRQHIMTAHGDAYLPAKAVRYKSSKGAQDAHEAIRPTDVTLTPEKLAPYLDKDLLNLYTLVWKRFVASQMSPAVYDQTAITVKAGDCELRASGSVMRFLGFMSLYVEAVDENGNGKSVEQTGEDIALPDLKKGDRLQLNDLRAEQHFTQPPPRFNEASLVKALEENGVGRPSTYAAIISTILDKEYVRLEKRKFYPTDLGRLVTELLVAHFPDIMDVEFTASMESGLDKVEEGKVKWLQLLKEFYQPFEQTLAAAKKSMRSVKKGVSTGLSCPLCSGNLMIKLGKMGEFLACENYPECKHTQNFRKDKDGKIVPVDREQPEESGEVCEKCGRPMVYKHGRFGRFLACSGYPECRHIRPMTLGVDCPEKDCDGELVQKFSRKGKVFYSCNRYPECKYALWDKPVKKQCPSCNFPFLLEKHTKAKGAFLKCANESCKYTEKLTDDE